MCEKEYTQPDAEAPSTILSQGVYRTRCTEMVVNHETGNVPFDHE